jgi:hypothetical protein
MIELQNISKIYRTAEVETHALADVSLGGGRVRRAHGPVRLRQIDPAQHPGLPRPPDGGSYRLLGEEVATLSDAG